MTAVVAPPTGQLELGRVIREGFGFIARRPLAVVLLAVCLVYLPAIAEQWANAGLEALRPKQGAPGFWGGFWRQMGLLLPISFLTVGVNWIFQGGVALWTLSDTTGESGATSRLAPRSPLLFATGIVSNIVVFMGTLALVVPGLLLGLAWCAGPAVVAVEDRSFFNAFGRSAQLTRGNRGTIFGLFVLFALARGGALYGLRAALGVPSLLQATTGPNYLIYVIQPAVSSAFSVVYAAVMAAIYFELRRLHDGVATGSLAATFD